MMKRECLNIVEAKCNSCKSCALASTRHNVVFADGRAARCRNANVDCLRGFRRVPLAPNQLRTVLRIHTIPHRAHLVFDVKPHRYGIFGSRHPYLRIHKIINRFFRRNGNKSQSLVFCYLPRHLPLGEPQSCLSVRLAAVRLVL